jgi:hypothetical protein
MQALPGLTDSAPQVPKSIARPGTQARLVAGVSPNPPTWAELPAIRRRRLVAVLGTLVQRTREESEHGQTGCSGYVHDADEHFGTDQ